jgi:hypothetical protein
MRMFLGILSTAVFFTAGIMILALVATQPYRAAEAGCGLVSGFSLICVGVAITVVISREKEVV